MCLSECHRGINNAWSKGQVHSSVVLDPPLPSREE